MEGKIGIPELLVILFIALLVFGPSKLGALGKSLGEAIRGFRSAMNGSEKVEKPGEKPDSKT
jgi:sec-independent protein translocase protein TatA